MRNIFSSFLCVACIFFCRYNFKLQALPFTMLEIMQFVGIVYLLLLLAYNKLHITQKLLGVFIFSIVLGCCALFSALRDLSGSMTLIRMMLEVIFLFGIFLFIINRCYYVKGNKNYSISKILDCWIYASVVQMLITIVFFVNHNIYEYVQSFLEQTTIDLERQELLTIRMMGLGNSFFGAGFNYSLDILVMSFIPYLKGSAIYKRKWIYWSICCLILIVGFLSARTFIVGVGFALLFIFINERKRIWHFLKGSVKLIIILSLSCWLAYLFLLKYIPTLDLVFEWAFELFINLFSGDGMRSDSTDVLFDMYIFPDNISTWLIGDGKFMLPSGGYYMHTDVGFIRLIFFWGMPMTVLYYFYQVYLIRKIYKNTDCESLKSFLICVILLVFICNLKGLINANNLIMLILMYVFFIEKRYVMKSNNRT